MPNCCVVGCYTTSKTPNAKLFTFPTIDKRSTKCLEFSKNRLLKWMAALKKPTLAECKNLKICHLHFISGMKAKLVDIDNTDWVPSLNLYDDDTDFVFQGAPDFTNEVKKEDSELYASATDDDDGIIKGGDGDSTGDTTFKSEVVVKIEPIDITDFPVIKCEEDLDIKIERPATPTNAIAIRSIDSETDVESIKSEISTNFYEKTAVTAGEKKFICNECGTEFRRKSNLVTHMQSHSAVKRFICDECGQKFARLDYLNRHKQLHSGDKLFGCEQCGMRFAQKKHLKPHEQTHSAIKAFPCDECEARFSRKSNLIVHKKTHSGDTKFVCDMCEKRFTRKEYLVKHKRIHTGEKPYGCEECGKEYSQKSQLQRHRNTQHRNNGAKAAETPFVCELCGRAFSRKSNLKRHTLARSCVVDPVPEIILG